MAPSKNLWTADMYRRLLNGTSFLIGGFLAIAFALVIPLFAFGFMDDDFFFVALLLLAWPVLCLVGLFRIRGVFRDLVEAADPAPKTEAAAPARESDSWTIAQRIPKPEAVLQSLQPTAESYWEQQAVGSRTARKQVWKEPEKLPETAAEIDWEQWVGKKLLQKAGILIVLIGMLVFLKYSFDNRWIDELGRVFLSAAAGGALLGAGELFHRSYAKWSQAFTGGGLVLLYLTVWVAHVFYAMPLEDKYGLVIPAALALVLYAGITVTGALAAVRYNAQIIAWFTVLGGYLTPFLVNGRTDVTALLIYLAMLAGGMILLAWHKKWRHLNLAAFIFTQFYLYTSVYTAVPEFGDVYQIVTAAAFFLLFNVLPILYQFRLRETSDGQDIALIVMNAAAVFLPVVDALGGWGGGYVGIVCFALAAFYLVFSALALQNRGDDDGLVNTYLTGTVLLVAGGLLAELESEWVAAGWAPLSLLLTFIAARLRRRGPWLMAWALLAGALFFLLINMPFITAGPEEIWRPFLSSWAIQSYVVFASVIGWLRLSSTMPAELVGKDEQPSLAGALHLILAGLLFLAVTFEATRLNFQIDLVWTFAYIALAVVAMGVFFVTESIVWFALAFLVQVLSLMFIFVFGESSGMAFYVNDPVSPFLHPWSYLSVLSLLATMAMVYVAQLKRNRFSAGLPAHALLTVVALVQVWVHVTVEIGNLAEAFDWTALTEDRALTLWWSLYALAVMGYGLLKKNEGVTRVAVFLLAIPFVSNHFSILGGEERMIETMLWTAVSLGVAVAGVRTKRRHLLLAGAGFLACAAGIDMISHLADSNAGLIRSSWWALAGLVTVIAGFIEREPLLRRLAMVIFGATALKLLIVDFSGLTTPVRIGASIVTGLLMIGASYLYQRFDSMLAPVAASPKK